MKIILFVFLVFLYDFLSFSQTKEQKFVNEYLTLVNEVRKSPSAFAQKYALDLAEYPEFSEMLKSKTKIPEIVFDKKLTANITRLLAGKYTEADFDGTVCGMSGSETDFDVENFEDKKEILEYYFEILDEDQTNIFDPAIIKLGMNVKITGENVHMRFIYGSTCDLASLREKYFYKEKVDTSKVDFKKLNTAKSVTYLSEAEKRMVQEINFVRCYPKEYAAIIASEMSKRSEKDKGLLPAEITALNELLVRLKTMTPLTPIQASECIYKAAKKHGLDMKAHNFIAHEGSTDSEPSDRMKKECTSVGDTGENIGGGDEKLRDKMIDLLLDDGITGRGHRETLLDPSWTHVGVAYVPKVGIMEHVWVQDFVKF